MNLKGPVFILILTLSLFAGKVAAQCVVNAGPDEIICQDNTSTPLGGSIGDGTSAEWTSSAGGVFIPNENDLNATWTPGSGYSGTATLTLTASGGSCGPTSDTKQVVVNPSTGATNFIAGAITVCQDAAGETYTATAANSISIDYTVLPVTAGEINLTTGVMNWEAAFSGTATITATSTGLCGITTADREVTVNPLPAAITGTMNVCVGSTTALSSVTAGGTWSSDTPSVATVIPASGVVTGVSSETSVITYALGTGCLVTTTVIVNPLPTPSAIFHQ